MTHALLMIGLHPDVPSPISADEVRRAQTSARSALETLGMHVELCAVQPELDPVAQVSAVLRARRYDCVCIGAGLRLLPEYTALFEAIVNAVHSDAPGARFCFNLGPLDTAQAVQRCLGLDSAALEQQ